MPRVSDEVIFMELILEIAIFILIALLSGVVLINYYEQGRNDKLTLTSLLSAIKEFFQNPQSTLELIST